MIKIVGLLRVESMHTSLTLIFHVGGGLLALLSGAAALSVRKGSRLHQVSGNVFFATMLIMAASGAYIAYTKEVKLSLLAGFFTCYLVATAWMTIKRKAGETGFSEIGALLVAVPLCIAYLNFGLEAMNSGTGSKDGFPAGLYFFWGGRGGVCRSHGLADGQSRRGFRRATHREASLAHVPGATDCRRFVFSRSTAGVP